jgi:hypothetical protein
VLEFFLVSAVNTAVGERDKNWVRESGKDSPLVREIITSYLRLKL